MVGLLLWGGYFTALSAGVVLVTAAIFGRWGIAACAVVVGLLGIAGGIASFRLCSKDQIIPEQVVENV